MVCVELENLYHIEADYPTVTYFKDLRTLNRAKENHTQRVGQV